jgi:alkanesulfonate monooxygenase SsuD/methylene tetrahydromethanopterin reductase-like flavin-dependent oxidoreductase (luciferase family)
MRIGVVILSDLLWAEALPRWQQAESIGFSTAWTYDHMSWRQLRDDPWLGTVPLLAAVAASTTTLRFGTLVTSPNFRHPAVLAKDAMTLDHISNGRLELGIGSGGTGWDAELFGEAPLPPRERFERFADFVRALDVLLSEPKTNYGGSHYTVIESRIEPGCAQQPRVPFTIGAGGPKALRIAAEFGRAWVTYGPVGAENTAASWNSAVTKQVADLEQACEAIGRDPQSIDRVALVSLEAAWAQNTVPAWDDFVGQAEALGFTDIAVHWPRAHDAVLAGAAPAVFDEICSRLGS